MPRTLSEVSAADLARQVTTRAKARLQQRAQLRNQRIWCDFECGRLYLRGQVPTYYLKQLAQEAVVDLDGVLHIINEIEVIW